MTQQAFEYWKQNQDPRRGCRHAIDNRTGSLDNEGGFRGTSRAMDITACILQQINADHRQPADVEFNRAALALFEYQHEHCPPYRRLCAQIGRTPLNVLHWREIPPIPVTAYKWMEVTCRPAAQALRVFRSSGTTREAYRSRHFLFDLELAKAAIIPAFRRHLVPEGGRMPVFILTPSAAEMPDSSLAFMLDTVVNALGTAESGFFIRNGKLESARLVTALKESRRPVLLVGASFSFVHFFDGLMDERVRIQLPAGSRLMDTGGFKGKSKTVSRAELYRLCEDLLGIAEAFCVNEYGMSEMSSQFYDKVAGDTSSRAFFPPPQVRTEILDPISLLPVQEKGTGLLCHFDLANRDSAMALLTEDLGRWTDGGFELLGRAPEAQVKGCSLLIDALLQGAP